MTTLLYALGLDDEEILSTFYKMIPIKESKRGWKMPFMAEKMRGMTPLADLMDARTGDVVAKAGDKMTARKARELAENGLKEVLVSSEDLAGRYIAEDIVNLDSGQISPKRGDELDAKLLAELKDQKVKEFHVLDIDPRQCRAVHPQHAQHRQELERPGSADGHLPGHAPGRAADHRGGDQTCSTACSSTASAMTSRPLAA